MKTCLSKLVEANYLSMLMLTPESLQVKVIHDELSIALWMNLDQTFYITISALRLSEMDEAKLALLISHELAHYLLDH